jgi:hypothetical protein
MVPCFGQGARAEEGGHENDTKQYKWFLTVYGGASAQDDLSDVLSGQAKFEDDAYVAVVALAREFWRYQDYIGLEVEGQVGRHFNRDSLWEFNGLLVARWHPFPWDKYVETSFAVGDGLSYYTEVSEVEEQEDEDAQRLLNYLLLELTLGLPRYPRWDMVVRIHHRSSVGKLIGAAGSNYVCAGIKYSF